MSSALHFERLVPYLVAALLVIAGVPAAISAASADSTADAASDPEVRLTETLYHEQRGDVFEIGVSLSGTDAGTVRFNPDANDSATVVVRDEDGDGRATLLLNTYDWSFETDGDDGFTVREPATDSLVADGDVDAVAHPGTGIDRDPTDVATLVVSERVTDDLQTWVAPRSADLSNLSAIDAAKASGNLTRTGIVAKNDTLVLELRASGLEGALAARNRSNVTARFFDLFESESASLVVRETAPLTSQESAYLDVLHPNATTVVADARNDSYYLVVDLQDASVTDGHGGVPANNRNVRGECRANVTLSNRSALADGHESVTTDFGIHDRRAHVETVTGEVFVEPAANQTIFGETTLAPGNRLTVEVSSEDGEFDQSKTVRVRNGTEGGSGVFVATFDFDDVAEGTDFTVTVEAAGSSTLKESSDPVEGTVVTATASVDVNDRGVSEHGIMVEKATLSHGGYVAIHRGSPDGEVLGRSEQIGPDERYSRLVSFDAPLESNTTLVAVVHHDGSGDALGDSYTENGTIIADSARYTTTPETTETTTRTTERTTHTTGTTDSPMRKETTTDDSRTTPRTEGPVPGFGVLSALAALAIGLLRQRR